MKKLLPGIFTFMSILSCNHFGKNTSGATDSAKTDSALTGHSRVYMSLNGISETAAKSMIASFVPGGDTKPNSAQFWFDKKVLDSIFTLFHADSLSSKKPDGIRFYFYTMPVTASTPLHSNTGLVIVSTYATTKVVSGQTVQVHTDYYNHPSAGLFSLSAALLSGEFTHYTDDSQGALLFDVCNCNVPFTMDSPHDIKPSVAEKMVKDFPGAAFNAESEWFDLELFKHFKKRIDADGGDGIRIYFGRGLDKADNQVKAKLLFVETMAVLPPTTPAKHKDYFGNKVKPGPTTPTPPPPPPNVGETGESCPPHCS